MSDSQGPTQDYVRAAGEVGEEGQFSIKPQELSWLLQCTFQWNMLRLELLTVLQRSLDLPTAEESEDSTFAQLTADMKRLLSDVIIMQTRVNRREENLAHLLDQAIDGEVLQGVPIDPKQLRQWAESIAQAQRHMEGEKRP